MSLFKLRVAFGVRVRHVEPRSRRRELHELFEDFVVACEESPQAPLDPATLAEEAFVALTERAKGASVDFALSVVVVYLLQLGLLNKTVAPTVGDRLADLFRTAAVDFDAVRRTVRALVV